MTDAFKPLDHLTYAVFYQNDINYMNGLRAAAAGHPSPDECLDPECHVCAVRACPHEEPLHFHHDGCPACYFDPIQDPANHSRLYRPYSSRYHAGFELPTPDDIRAAAFNFPWRRPFCRPPVRRPEEGGDDPMNDAPWDCYWAEMEVDTAAAARHYAWPMEDVNSGEVEDALEYIYNRHDCLMPPRGWHEIEPLV